MAQFQNLPAEIQLQIFELAAARDCQPRVVGIYFKSGQIYSKSSPPALLHVCQLSRWVILKRYKPWLLQFKGKPWHKPYERAVRKYAQGLSRLNNVCIDLDNDTLLINQQQWVEWDFGPLERRRLRAIALNLGGWLDWSKAVPFLQKFRKLRTAGVFDSEGNDTRIDFKVLQIIRGLERRGRHYTKKGVAKSAPLISSAVVRGGSGWTKALHQWNTYKYPKGYHSGTQNSRVARHLGDDISTGAFGAHEDRNRTAEQPVRLGMRSSSSYAANLLVGKRKRDQHQGSKYSFGKVRKLVNNSSFNATKQSLNQSITVVSAEEESENDIQTRQFIMPDLEDFFDYQPSSQELSISTEDLSVSTSEDRMQEHSLLKEDVAPGSDSSPVSWEVTADKSFAEIFDEIDFWCTPSPEQDARREISSPINLNSSPFQSPMKHFQDLDTSSPISDHFFFGDAPAFSLSFADSGTTLFNQSDGVQTLESLNLESVTGPDDQDTSCFEHFDLSGWFGENNDPVDFETENSGLQEMNLGAPQRSTSQRLPVGGAFQTASIAAISVKDRTHSTLRANKRPVVEIRVPSPTTAPTGASETGAVPVRMIAERVTSGELEYLVKWANGCHESWVHEKTIMRIAPGLLEKWKIMSTAIPGSLQADTIVLEYVVEKILSRKSVDGVPHYLVKWEGYPEMKDRTLEPCDRLRVDVPALVDEYELKRRRKKRKRS